MPHIVIRGTYLPGTIRCSYGNRFRPPAYTGSWGYNTFPLLLQCYADVRVNAYILGSGPPVLTVEVAHETYNDEWTNEEVVGLKRRYVRALMEGGDLHSEYSIEAGGTAGREEILFIGPSVDMSTEAWKLFRAWNLARTSGGAVVAAHPDRGYWLSRGPEYRSQLEIELLTFEQAVTEAHEARVAANDGRTASDPSYPMLVTDANRLSDFFREIGAYDHPDGPPAEPLPTGPPPS